MVKFPYIMLSLSLSVNIYMRVGGWWFGGSSCINLHNFHTHTHTHTHRYIYIYIDIFIYIYIYIYIYN